MSAKAKGLSAISVCDHDTIAAYERLRPACEEAGITLVQGVELDVAWQSSRLHLLGLGFNPTHRPLLDIINKGRTELDALGDDLIRNMSPDFPQINLEYYRTYMYPRNRGGWKSINYLFDLGLTSELLEAMRYYGQYSRYTPDFPTLAEACRLIRDAGGVPVLAHPGNWWLPMPKNFEEILKGLMCDGIGGIECFYPSHTRELINACTDFCLENQLCITCGCDGHGGFNNMVNGVEYDIGILKIDSKFLDLRGIT